MVTLDPSVAGAAHAEERLRQDEMIWITTVRADGQPQASAVWFHWDGTDFLLVSQPRAPKVRNLAVNPRVSLNFNGAGYGADLVVVEGTAEVLPDYASGSWPELSRVEAYYDLQHRPPHHPHPLAHNPLTPPPADNRLASHGRDREDGGAKGLEDPTKWTRLLSGR